MKLNLGCGAQVAPGWVNVDYALGARLARLPLAGPLSRHLFDLAWSREIVVHDLRRALPWASGSADAIYSSHTLEHLDRERGRALLAECRRVLRAGGRLRIVVPDLAAIVARYVDRRLPAEHVLEELGVLLEPRRSRLKRALAPFVQFPHRCMYDTPALLRILAELGFAAAPAAPLESAIEDIGAVELAERTVDAVIVEAVRPPDGGSPP